MSGEYLLIVLCVSLANFFTADKVHLVLACDFLLQVSSVCRNWYGAWTSACCLSEPHAMFKARKKCCLLCAHRGARGGGDPALQLPRLAL